MEIPMNKTMLAVVLCSVFATPAGAATISGGKISSVNAGGTSFSYSKKKRNWTFKITDMTIVRVGKKTGNLSDLKTGQSVKVEFQRQDGSLAALIIGIGF
jgi:Cu/Ag efflux protein CusF